MAFIVVSDVERPGLLLSVDGNTSLISTDLALYKGEIFGDLSTFRRAITKPDLNLLGSVKGEFVLVRYCHRSSKLYIGTDRLGRENLFYYADGKRFVVSDDFWEIVSYLNIGISDLDAESIKEFVTFNYPVFYGTIVRDLSFLPPASYGEFDLTTRQLHLYKYWDLRYVPDRSISVSDAVCQLDHAIDQTIKRIRDLNPSATYGVGLSGGLDSRLIPHYALANALPIRSFIIGEKRPHLFCLSRDHASARAIAAFYGVEHTEVEWDEDGFEEKMIRDVRYYPMGASQFFITVWKNIPDFDVLLTDASGMIVGSEIPLSVMKMSQEDLLNVMISHCSLLGKGSTLLNRARRGIGEISGLSVFATEVRTSGLEGFLSRKEYDAVREKFARMIRRGLAEGKSNLDVFQEYFVFFLGSRNKLGAFESLQGLKKAYSIYASDALDVTLKWSAECLLDRLVLKETIRRIVPHLATIEAQDHRPAIAMEGTSGTIMKLSAMSRFTLRGSGVGRHEVWARRKAYRRYACGILHRYNPVFESVVGVQRALAWGKRNPRFLEKVLKTKVILDLIESGRYKALTNSRPCVQPVTVLRLTEDQWTCCCPGGALVRR